MRHRVGQQALHRRAALTAAIGQGGLGRPSTTPAVELAQEGAPIVASTILPASIDTPFFEHACSKLGAMPKPPPPVHAPEIVADAIVSTPTPPPRGGCRRRRGLGVTGQRLSPALVKLTRRPRRARRVGTLHALSAPYALA